MKLHSIHHAAIIVSDYSSAIAFYVDILGLRILRDQNRPSKDDRKIDLELPDGTQLELFVKKNCPKRCTYPEAYGFRHIAFMVNHIEEVLEELNAKQVKTEPIKIDPDTKKATAFFYDPDGLPLELVEN